MARDEGTLPGRHCAVPHARLLDLTAVDQQRDAPSTTTSRPLAPGGGNCSSLFGEARESAAVMGYSRVQVLIVCSAMMVGAYGATTSGGMPNPAGNHAMTQAAVLTVTSVSDEINGNVATVAHLTSEPGPDGISLREAIEATNADPGAYTIRFASDLAGSTIEASAELPWLEAGGLTIDGDIDGDTRPDVTVHAAAPTDRPCFVVTSSDNSLHAIEVTGGWGSGVTLLSTRPGETYANTTISSMVIRGTRNGVLLSADGWPSESRLTEHRWVNTRIIGNKINATYEGVGVQLAKTISDVVDGLIINGNEINVDGGTEEPSAAILLMAGFWAGSTENQIIDVEIAENSIGEAPGGAVWLSTGMVGASTNLISDVRIRENLIGGTTGILVTASDATTAWHDPSHTPIGVPNENKIHDIEIVDNTIEWNGFGGIQIVAGSPGSGNEVVDVKISDNDLSGRAGEPGIFIVAAGGDRATSNRVSAVRIERNRIRVTGVDDRAAGIMLMGASDGASRNDLSDVYIAHNDIETNITGIHIHGAGPQSVGNQLSAIEIFCNRIDAVPEIIINGGRGVGATGNAVFDVTLTANLTGDALNHVTALANAEGAGGNTIDWTAVDAVPDDCPIAAPSPRAKQPTTTALGAPASPASMDSDEASGFDWFWLLGGAALAVLGVVSLLGHQRSRRNKTHDRAG